MEATARSLPDGVRVKFRAEHGRLLRGASVRPIEDGGGRRARGVDSHQAVPERGAPDGRDASGRIAEARDYPVDGVHGQIEQRLSWEGGAPARCRLERVGKLLLGLGDGATQVVER